MARPSSERDGACICNYGPDTEGPDECCPFHGRPYAYWVERGDVLQRRAEVAEAAIDRVRRRHPRGDEEPGPLAPGLWCPGCGEPRGDDGWGACRDRKALSEPLSAPRSDGGADPRVETPGTGASEPREGRS